MRKIVLHGHLTEFGDEFTLDVATAGEAIRAIGTQIKEFAEALKEGSYAVVRGDPKDKGSYSLELDHINSLKLGDADLHIVPMIEGRKEGNMGGILKAILGIALIGVAIFFSGGTAAGLAASIGGTGITWGNVALIGGALALAGVASLLTPKDKPKDEGEDKSYALRGPSTTSEQGSVIPLVYGEVITGGVIVSAGMDIENIGSYKGSS
ncbi:MAG: tail assembly protein [Roseibium sp.]|nr:tail assembly protein [Roseibium sp.]